METKIPKSKTLSTFFRIKKSKNSGKNWKKLKRKNLMPSNTMIIGILNNCRRKKLNSKSNWMKTWTNLLEISEGTTSNVTKWLLFSTLKPIKDKFYNSSRKENKMEGIFLNISIIQRYNMALNTTSRWKKLLNLTKSTGNTLTNQTIRENSSFWEAGVWLFYSWQLSPSLSTSSCWLRLTFSCRPFKWNTTIQTMKMLNTKRFLPQSSCLWHFLVSYCSISLSWAKCFTFLFIWKDTLILTRKVILLLWSIR